MKKKPILKWIRIIWLCFGVIFFIWQWSSYQATGKVSSFSVSSNSVEFIASDDKISFMNNDASSAEVIFFPGGLVDPDAYIPLAKTLSEGGYNVHIIKMPWRMATKGYENIKQLFDLTDPDKVYILGGHSQGGKMAAQFVYENRGIISGLFLLGTSHPRDINLSDMDIPTLKLYAEHDGLASVEEVSQNRDKMPANTKLIEIKGGNHSQFAFIGHLLLDESADISRDEQHKQVVSHLLPFFNGVSKSQ